MCVKKKKKTQAFGGQGSRKGRLYSRVAIFCCRAPQNPHWTVSLYHSPWTFADQLPTEAGEAACPHNSTLTTQADLLGKDDAFLL